MNKFRNCPPDWQPFVTLHGFVRLVLLVDWDPIGIFGNPGAMDEYDSYVASVCQLLQAGADRYQLIAHLNNLETQSMGMHRNEDHLEKTVDKLLLLYRRSA